MNIILSGASGLVGSFLVNQLSKNEEVVEILSLVRKKSEILPSKVIELEVDFSSLSKLTLEKKYDIAFCALGTTIKKAGSKTNQQQIDRGFVENFAILCKKSYVKNIGVVSSLGTDAKSNNFYLRTKGEMENKVIDAEIAHSVFIRPSILIGKRNEFRFGEKVGVVFMKVFGFLFLGKLKKYKGVSAENVAKKLIHATMNSSQKVAFIESDEII